MKKIIGKIVDCKLDIGMWFADNNDSCCYQSRFNIYENNARVHI